MGSGDGGRSGLPLRRAAALLAALGLAASCALLGPRPLPPDVLGELVGRAERARGLRFEAPVDAVVVTPGRLRRLLAEEVDAGVAAEDFTRAEAVGRALGLYPPSFDLRAALLDLQARTVAGFYTPLRRRLVLVLDGPPDGGLTRGAEEVAVHELVHALQDAHSKLLAVLLGLEDHDDLAFALGALLEGDAVHAAFRDRAAREEVPPPTAADFAAAFESEPVEPGQAALPRFLLDSYLLQYPRGYALVEGLEARGGGAALDAALADPPLSSEELLHPAAYLEGRPRPPLPLLRLEDALGRAGVRALASDTVGELGLRAWALERGAPEAQAAAAAEGWDGDRAVVLEGEGEGERAFAWLLQFDGERDTGEFSAVAAPRLRPGEDLEREGRRLLLSRGLAPDARRAALAAGADAFADLDAYLAARPQVLARAERLRRVARGAARP